MEQCFLFDHYRYFGPFQCSVSLKCPELVVIVLIDYRWAFAQMGYGPGIALYTVFGGFAM
jgi:hypothetical protein